jgi:hypothetical protein
MVRLSNAPMIVLLSSLVACGGKAIVDDSGGSGGTTTSSSTSSSSSSTSASSSGTVGCEDHSDCPDEWVCVYDTGVCALRCGDPCQPCGAGEICDICATSSCPGCKDCTGACVAAAAGQCDDHMDCAAQEACIFGMSQCAPSCTSMGCADPNLVCQDCATSSCACCLDCGSACVPAS